jgi:hypothetical protein
MQYRHEYQFAEGGEEKVSVSVRRATIDDEHDIIALIGEEGFVMTKYFGDYNVDSMIETSFLSVVAIDNSNNSIIGFAVFQCNPPNYDQLEQAIYDSLYSNTRANLWLAFFKAEPLHKEAVRDEILRTVFTTFSEVDNILFTPAQPLKTLTIFPLEDFPRLAEFFFGINRHQYTAKLVIRQGKVEDNDDLLYLLQYPNLTTVKVEGEFYIADLLHKQDDKNKILIATVILKIKLHSNLKVWGRICWFNVRLSEYT